MIKYLFYPAEEYICLIRVGKNLFGEKYAVKSCYNMIPQAQVKFIKKKREMN